LETSGYAEELRKEAIAPLWSWNLETLQQPIVAYKSESQLTTPFKKSDYD
jgi:hypothetical protein